MEELPGQNPQVKISNPQKFMSNNGDLILGICKGDEMKKGMVKWEGDLKNSEKLDCNTALLQ